MKDSSLYRLPRSKEGRVDMKSNIFLVISLALILASCSQTATQPVDTQISPTDTPELTPTDIPTSIPSTPDATADWPVYENAVLGYSFKYPSGCFFGPMPADCKGNPPEERPPECLCFLDSENPKKSSCRP